MSRRRLHPVSEIGDAERISKGYVSNILRLALLAPDIVEAILRGDGSGADAGEVGAVAAGELDGAAPTLTQGTHPLRNERHRHLACMGVLRAGAAEQGLQRRAAFRDRLLFLAPAVAVPGFGLASALDTVPVDARSFFLLALGFLASRLLLF